MKHIAIFASGTGSNALAIAQHFADSPVATVKIALSNRANAAVHDKMKLAGVPTVTFSREQWTQGDEILNVLRANDIDLIVLAGFLSIIPESIINAYERRIINIHPSLIPAFCGKGFYGLRVHEAALERGVKVTGATVHYVNEIPDGGEIIMQKCVSIRKDETPESLQKRVMKLAEWKILPKAAEEVCKKLLGE